MADLPAPLRQNLNLARQKKKENQKFLKNLARRKDLDQLFHPRHEEVFSRLDCLTCANCCKTTSPIFRDVDIDRIAKHLGMRPSAFTEKYLHIDEDNDWVLNSSPCAFLDSENYCTIYDVRPKACREYPHTDRKNMSQIMDLTYRNTLVCPAVVEMVESIKKAVG
ncbi:MAG TPA: YkgJ family cysteine cluster protein [Flavobacteriales bacterium]